MGGWLTTTLHLLLAGQMRLVQQVLAYYSAGCLPRLVELRYDANVDSISRHRCELHPRIQLEAVPKAILD